MKSYRINQNDRGWMSISGDVAVIVAHYKDGHKETMKVIEFAAYPEKRRNVIQIDCYTEDEKHLLGL